MNLRLSDSERAFYRSIATASGAPLTELIRTCLAHEAIRLGVQAPQQAAAD